MTSDVIRWYSNVFFFCSWSFFFFFAVYLLFNGTREKEEHLWVVSNAVTFYVDVSKDITFRELVDKVYETIDVDRFTFDLKLEVPYAMGTIPMALVVLKNDANVSYYMKHKNRKRFSLCISLVSKKIIASIANQGVVKAKNEMIEELSRFEPNKRRNNLIINDQHNVPIINNIHNGGEDDLHKGDEDNVCKSDEDEVYMRDRDDYHNSDKDDEVNSEGGDEHNSDRDDGHISDKGDGHNSDRGEEFGEFANPEEYKDFVDNFTVPSRHCQPLHEPPRIGSPMECVPYSWKVLEFRADDVVNEEPSQCFKSISNFFNM